jgi:hypothetical protein
MTIRTRQEYDEVLNSAWFVDERPPEEVTYVPVPILWMAEFPLRSHG